MLRLAHAVAIVKMKILFLDIDGVLNSSKYIRYGNELENPDGLTWEQSQIDPTAVETLNMIIDATGCFVVICSAWRTLHSRVELQEILTARGFRGKIIGTTPNLPGKTRGDEIQAWIDNFVKLRKKIDKFAILDDLDEGHVSMRHLTSHLIQTSLENGLTDYEAKRAIKLLE